MNQTLAAAAIGRLRAAIRAALPAHPPALAGGAGPDNSARAPATAEVALLREALGGLRAADLALVSAWATAGRHGAAEAAPRLARLLRALEAWLDLPANDELIPWWGS